MVSRLCTASPETMFARLAPFENRRPRPLEWRRSISIASRGWFVTIALPRSFSHQRNAGMSSLSPCRSPAWQAPVCADQSGSQRVSSCGPPALPAAPGGRGRRVAALQPPPEDVLREAVDLEEEQPGHVGGPLALAASRLPLEIG